MLAVTPIPALLISSLTSVRDVEPAVKLRVVALEKSALVVKVEPFQVPKRRLSSSMPISAVIDEKPLPPLLKFNTCAWAIEVTLIVCANSLARLLSVRLKVTLLVLDERLSPIWPSNIAVFVWNTLSSFFSDPSAEIFTVAVSLASSILFCFGTRSASTRASTICGTFSPLPAPRALR